MRHHQHSALHSLIHRRGQMSPTAIVFLVLGIVFAVFALFAVIIGVALVLPAVQSARSAARNAQSSNNLKQIGLALHNYHDTFNSFPLGDAIPEFRPEPHHSWVTRILPYIEQGPLYNQIDMNEPWTTPKNAQVMTSSIKSLLNPHVADAGTVNGLGASHYAGSTHVFLENKTLSIRDVTDGTSNTILAGEVSGNFAAWGDPANRRDPALGLGSGPDQMGGAGGFPLCNLLLMDGSVRPVGLSVSPETMKALATPSGNEPVMGF